MITLNNDFHGTSTNVRPDSRGYISARAWKSATDRLCGIAGCTCGGVRGPQEDRIDFEGQDDGGVRVVKAAYWMEA
jgi:hypothetical protein